jgi:hypothetical protein
MKQTVLAMSLAMACGIITSAAAQRTPPDPQNEPAHNVFVLTGCLERGDAPSTFRLTRASSTGQLPPRANATPRATDAKDENAYELQPKSSVSEEGLRQEQLQADVGGRVEVTIRPVEASAATAPLTTSSTVTEKKPTESPRQRYTVIKLARVGGSCA